MGHRGVLFLDEAPEFQPHLLDALRTPLEEGEVRLARSEGTVCYPARFQLVLAANPCPCAPAHDRDCLCASTVRRRYLGRLSGPLLDRVDLRARMFPITTLAVASEDTENTATVRARVLRARAAAAQRWAAGGWRTNAEVPGPVLRTRFALTRSATRPLDAALRAGDLTARGADRGPVPAEHNQTSAAETPTSSAVARYGPSSRSRRTTRWHSDTASMVGTTHDGSRGVDTVPSIRPGTDYSEQRKDPGLCPEPALPPAGREPAVSAWLVRVTRLWRPGRR